MAVPVAVAVTAATTTDRAGAARVGPVVAEVGLGCRPRQAQRLAIARIAGRAVTECHLLVVLVLRGLAMVLSVAVALALRAAGVVELNDALCGVQRRTESTESDHDREHDAADAGRQSQAQPRR